MNEVKIKFNQQEVKVILRDDADISVNNEIFKFREYRAAEEVIQRASSPIIDVGAHAGFFSLYCRALNPQVKIYALEPEKDNQTAFSHNLRLNKTKGVTIVPAALAAQTGDRELLLTEDNHNHRLVGLSEKVTERTMKTKAYSLNDLFTNFNLIEVSLVKIDIEGGEYEIFSSLSPADYARINYFILEYHNLGNKNHKQLEQLLRSNGFGVQIFPSRFDKTMGFMLARNKRN